METRSRKKRITTLPNGNVVRSRQIVGNDPSTYLDNDANEERVSEKGEIVTGHTPYKGKTTENVAWSPLRIFGHAFLLAATIYGVMNTPLEWKTLAFSIAYYFVGGFSYTAGYHRLWAHHSYKATRILQILFAVFGSINFLGSIQNWCRDHRAHHRQPDGPRDPFNRKKGFMYAWLGCRLVQGHMIGDADISDLKKDWLVSLQHNLYFILALGFGWGLPAYICNFWGDAQGGLVYGGIVRTFLFLHLQYLFWVLGNTYGHQPYSDSHCGKNNTWLSILSLGENYLNFHREFPSDYRMGCFYYHMDITKWLLRFLSVVRLAHSFNKTDYIHILRVRVQRQEAELNKLRHLVDWGPSVETLPKWTVAEFKRRVEQGEQLMIMDSIVHDVADFYKDHPGGEEIMKTKIGKDATIAFNGGVQRHSKAARNLAVFMRVAIITDSDNTYELKDGDETDH